MKSFKVITTAAFKITTATIGFLSTFYTVINLMLFLSNPDLGKASTTSEITKESRWTWSLIVNTLLLSLFGLQHSLLALPYVKELFHKNGLKDIQRCVYIICTCGALELLIKNWQYTPNIFLWKLPMENPSIYSLYIVTHIASWLLIYIGSICMDINELLGIKQVYYSLYCLPDPISLKAVELQNLYSHMRHPSFIGFIIIYWFVPTLRLDRILLALFLTTYMYISWRTDDMDLNYQKKQICRKFQ